MAARTGNEASERHMDFVAATSLGRVNARNASYYYSRMMRGEGMPEIGSQNLAPWGHLAKFLHQRNAQDGHNTDYRLPSRTGFTRQRKSSGSTDRR
ncbi:MAG: hypothetical protein WBW73_28835 [Rhodoplanes sp.]